MDETAAISTIGRYQVRARLGRGGMGTLYLARDPAIGRPVAVKLLRVTGDEMRARFEREMRAAGRVHHRHIVAIYDVGEHAGQPFIAMEYVRGETLEEVIRRRRQWSLGRKLELLEQLCDGMGYAHAMGLVHRDLKPANLMVSNESGSLKILDFGIARLTGDTDLTVVGTTLGSPQYMSPEQAMGQPVDSRSDIFSIGAVMYELLLYQQAFAGDSWPQVRRLILSGSPVPLRTVDASLDPALDDILNRALAKSPDDRYADLRSLQEGLQAVRTALEGSRQQYQLRRPGGSKPGGDSRDPRAGHGEAVGEASSEAETIVRGRPGRVGDDERGPEESDAASIPHDNLE